MKLLILQKPLPNGTPVYRGTERSEPYYVDTQDADQPINLAFLRYTKIRYSNYEYNTQTIFDLHQIINLYRQLNPPQIYELVEVTENTEASIVCTAFLGFDISYLFDDSLLHNRLSICQDMLFNENIDKIIHPLKCLVENYFQPRLNKDGLFSNYTDANFCLECMMALQGIRRNLWAASDELYRVVGIWTTPE